MKIRLIVLSGMLAFPLFSASPSFADREGDELLAAAIGYLVGKHHGRVEERNRRRYYEYRRELPPCPPEDDGYRRYRPSYEREYGYRGSGYNSNYGYSRDSRYDYDRRPCPPRYRRSRGYEVDSYSETRSRRIVRPRYR